MKVFVESNFVLELTLEQEESEACAELLHLAEQGRVTLVVPAFSLFEPFTTLRRRERDRAALQRELQRELVQIRRTEAFKSEAAALPFEGLLVRTSQQARERFDSVLDRLLRIAQIAALDVDAFDRARAAQSEYALELPDALVLATVLGELRAAPARSCFLNRNTKDFDDPAIVEVLAKLDCRLVGSFTDGLALVLAEDPPSHVPRT